MHHFKSKRKKEIRSFYYLNYKMYPHWYSMQSNEKQIHDMPRQSTNQGAFRFQPNYP